MVKFEQANAQKLAAQKGWRRNAELKVSMLAQSAPIEHSFPGRLDFFVR